jgi:molybdopterin-containing oxidoreductase family membrane subunit
MISKVKEFIMTIPVNKVGIRELLNFEKSPQNILIATVTVVFLTLFAMGFAVYLTDGHHAYNVTREHPWGLLIAVYIFFVGTSTGLCIIASFGHIFGIKEFNPVGNKITYLAIVTLLAGFTVILLEIGHPFVMMLYNVLSPGLTSAIWWMGTLYTLVLGFIIIEFIFILKNDHKWSKIFGIGGLIADVAAFSTLGSIFGYLVARPAMNGPFLPLYFILTAIVVGAYLLFIVYGISYKMEFPEEIKSFLLKLAKILGLLLAILIFFDFWAIMTGIYGRLPERADTIMYILTTKSYWIGEILMGTIIPFIIILQSKGQDIKKLVWASFFGLIGVFFMRYDMVHNTQVFPMQTLKIREYQLPPEWIEYFPSSTEIMISLGAVGLFIAIYYAGTKFFNLNDEHH